MQNRVNFGHRPVPLAVVCVPTPPEGWGGDTDTPPTTGQHNITPIKHNENNNTGRGNVGVFANFGVWLCTHRCQPMFNHTAMSPPHHPTTMWSAV